MSQVPKCAPGQPCEFHDRMDRLVQYVDREGKALDEFYDAACGTPVGPRGDPRWCCTECPERGQPLRLKANWAQSPILQHLSPEERRGVRLLWLEQQEADEAARRGTA